MRGNRATGTTPEILLRKALWRRGHRYRLHRDDLPGKPDIVFARQRVAVFCDGDFWHGKDWPERKWKLERGSNAAYWTAKIEGNMERDRRQTAELEAAGWTVIRIWESEIRTDAQAVAGMIARALHRFS